MPVETVQCVRLSRPRQSSVSTIYVHQNSAECVPRFFGSTEHAPVRAVQNCCVLCRAVALRQKMLACCGKRAFIGSSSCSQHSIFPVGDQPDGYSRGHHNANTTLPSSSRRHTPIVTSTSSANAAKRRLSRLAASRAGNRPRFACPRRNDAPPVPPLLSMSSNSSCSAGSFSAALMDSFRRCRTTSSSHPMRCTVAASIPA